MAERDLSELDLRTAFAAYLEDAPADVRPTELARHLATAYPHRRTVLGRWGFRASTALAWAVLLAGLLLAVIAGVLAVGAAYRDRALVTPEATRVALVPTGIEMLPPGPTGFTRMVATSRDELWVISGPVVWHFRDGVWTSEEIDAGRIVGSDESPNHAVTLAPDGTVWAAGAQGVAYRRDGRWVVVDAHATSAVAVDRTGTVWVAGTARDCDIWGLRSDGITWTRTPADCPFDFGGGAVTTMAVDGRGTLWVGAIGFVVNGLANYADGRWEATGSRAGLPNDISVQILGVSAAGDVWIDFQVASTATHARARFDGATWTVISGAEDMAVAVAPDGAKWASAIARYAEPGWAYPYPGVKPPLTPLAVAPDGTVFAVDADMRFVRLPAPSPSP